MNIESIHLKNFGVYKDASINFSELQSSCIVAPTGSGKTFLLFESLTYCLYGKTTKTNVIKYGESSCSVSVVLEKDGSNYEIVRQQSISKRGARSNLLDVIIDGRSIELKNIIDVQRFIENDVIGMSYNIFTNSIILLQNNSNDFLFAPTTKKMEFFMDIFDLTRFSKYQDKAKELIKENANKTSESRGQIMVLESRIKNIDTVRAEIISKKREHDHYSEVLKGLSEKRQKLIDMRLQYSQSATDATNEKQRLLTEKSKFTDLRDNVSGEIFRIEAKMAEEKETAKTDLQVLREDLVGQDALKTEYKRLIADESNIVSKKSIADEYLIFSEHYNVYLKKMNEISNLEKHVVSTDKYKMQIDQLELDCKNIMLEINDVPKCNKCGEPYHEYRERIQKKIDEKKETIFNMKKTIVNIENENKPIEKQIKEIKEFLKDDKYADLELKMQKANDIDVFVAKDEYNKLSVAKESVQALQAKINRMISKIESLKSTIASLESIDVNEATGKLMAKVQMYNREIAKIDTMLQNVNIKYKLLEDPSKKIEELDTRISNGNALIEDITVSIRVLSKEIEDAVADKLKIAEIQKSISEFEDESKLLFMLSQSFGKNGIPLYLLQAFTPVLENKINNKLSGITNFRISIESERTNRDGTSVDALEIKIIHSANNTVDDIDSLSGGQKTLLRLAFILSISEMLRKQTGDSIEFLALDEAIIGLDEDTEVKACEMLQKEIEDIGNIFIISHSKNVQNLFSSFIYVSNNNGNSTIHFTQ